MRHNRSDKKQNQVQTCLRDWVLQRVENLIVKQAYIIFYTTLWNCQFLKQKQIGLLNVSGEC